ncbi:MAG: IclR family transcriptional regulator [Chloroflexi bacterium]|nr:MAG: IclR family transcriptional regulator [Chloroflexota bacterium]
MDQPDDRYFVTALARGMQILEAFSGERHHLSLTEVASSAGLEKSTAFRFIYTLEQLGYLERDPETKMYRLILKLLRFGFAALNSLELVQIAQPLLKALSIRCGETTNMSVRDAGEIVYVARNKTQGILNVGLEIGSRLPVWCTSMGKAQLIDLSPAELRALLGAGPFPGTGPNAAANLQALLCDLEGVRQRGYAVNDEELAAGVRSVAAPVRDRSGAIVAAINISVPSARVSREEIDTRLAPMVQETAQRISQALGAEVAPLAPATQRT